jgi:hypothetical protein
VEIQAPAAAAPLRLPVQRCLLGCRPTGLLARRARWLHSGMLEIEDCAWTRLLTCEVYERRDYRLPEPLKRLTNMKHPTLLAFCLLFFVTHTMTVDRYSSDVLSSNFLIFSAMLGYMMMSFTYMSSNITNEDAEYVMQKYVLV